MESFKQEELNNIYNLGIEFAFEHISPEKYKSNNTEEKRIFLNGYKAGLNELNKQNVIIEESSIKKVA